MGNGGAPAKGAAKGTGYVRATFFPTRVASRKHVSPLATVRSVGPFSPFSSFFGCCCCFATTQLARQLQQERTQVVCSNKEARKRLVRRHSCNSCHTPRSHFSGDQLCSSRKATAVATCQTPFPVCFHCMPSVSTYQCLAPGCVCLAVLFALID